MYNALMAKKTSKARKNTELVKRDEKGLWLPGQSPNPGGRPKGFSITAAVKRKLAESPPGMKNKTYLDLICEKLMAKALKEGDVVTLKAMWAYMDGTPKQTVHMEVEDINKTIENLHDKA